MSNDESSLEYIEDPYFNPSIATLTPSLDDDDLHGTVRDSSTETEIDIFDLRQLDFDDFPSCAKYDGLAESVNIEAEFVDVKRANTIIRTFFKTAPKKHVRVTYCDLTKPYKVKLTSDTNFRKYLRIATGDEMHGNMAGDFATERGSLSAEEREKQEREWKAELDQIEDEISTLRSVLAAKMRLSGELKRKLGITAWKEISDDVNQGLKNVKDSTVYQKTSSIIGGITGGISNKLGQIRHSESFRSIEEKASSAIENVKAHTENVNCLALGPLGHNYGHVIATGGDDHKVNLWSVKESHKLSQVMNLCGHTAPVDCIQFNVTAEFLCSGSRSGEIKIYNLETNKLIRTLVGHQDGVRCMDFNPWGDFLVSGSTDCNIRLWDCRKRGSIFSYPCHKARINSVQFSPDGQWIATGADDCAIKIWDLRVLRVLKEFTEHVNSVTCVKFHPQEFLLASGSTDRSVHFYDLESFQLVSRERELSSVRCLTFNHDGDCLFVGARNHLKVIGWEPSRLYDSVSVNWDKVCDIRATTNELFGASFHLNKVSLYDVDLTTVKPFANRNNSLSLNTPSSPSKATFTPNTSLRKSFSKTERPSTGGLLLDGRTIEESTSGTDPEDNEVAIANIINLTDYNEIFKGNRTLNRTPPPPDIFVEQPENDTSTHEFIDVTSPQIIAEFKSLEEQRIFEALTLDHAINYYRPSFSVSPKTTHKTTIPSPPRETTPNKHPTSPYNRSKSNLDSVYNRARRTNPVDIVGAPNKHHLNRNNRDTPAKLNLHRQTSYKEPIQAQTRDSANNMRHCTSETSLHAKELSNRLGNSVCEPHSVAMSSRISTIGNGANATVVRATVDNRRSTIATTLSPIVDIHMNRGRERAEVEEEEEEQQWPEMDGDRDQYIPTTLDRPAGLNIDDFIPCVRENYDFRSNVRDDVIVSEAEALSVVMRGHEQVIALVTTRQRNLKIAMSQGRTKDCKGAVEMAISLNDMGVLVDLLTVYNNNYTLWNLDLCATVLPKLLELIQSKYETYINTGCNSLKLIVRYFGSVIKSNVQNPVGSFGVDIPREERYRKSMKCQEHFDSIAAIVLKKQSLCGNIGNTFKELKSMLKNALD